MTAHQSPSSSPSKEITPQKAAKQAAQYLQSFIPGAGSIRAEEIERDLDKPQWRITLSYESPDHPFAARTYKLFVVDAHTGDVLAMRMRKG